jgi:hypothetical protein
MDGGDALLHIYTHQNRAITLVTTSQPPKQTILPAEEVPIKVSSSSLVLVLARNPTLALNEQHSATVRSLY